MIRLEEDLQRQLNCSQQIQSDGLEVSVWKESSHTELSHYLKKELQSTKFINITHTVCNFSFTLRVFGLPKKDRGEAMMKFESCNRTPPLLLLGQNLAQPLLTTKMQLIIISGNSDILPSMEDFSVALCYQKELRFLNSQEYFYRLQQCHNISFRQILKIAGLKGSWNSHTASMSFPLLCE